MKTIGYEKRIAVILLGVFTGVFCYTFNEQADEREAGEMQDRQIAQRREADALERLPGGMLYDAEEADELEMDAPAFLSDETDSDSLSDSDESPVDTDTDSACSGPAIPQR